jgi:hypothetical protein
VSVRGDRLAQRRQAQRVGAAGFAAALLLPIVLWHRVIADIASQFEVSLDYLVRGWTPWLLMAAGLGFLVPVLLSTWLDPRSRWYPRGRNAYAGWGVTLYLLGFLLATQLAQIYGISP